MKKVLLTSVCRPIGPAHGDAPSVGYELLHGQVTRAQGIFSPRSVHLHFSLEYIAENLESPCLVLQYPSKKELIAELAKGYDYVCLSFLLALHHRMKEVVELIREHSPRTKIVLGGYGTVLSDEELLPWGDYICREEGVEFMRALLGEEKIAMPYRHPLIISQLKIFGAPVSRTGMIFAGLGCPNGCDFCCTSHFFKRKHIRLLPTGRDIYDVVERYLETDPDLSLVVLDEDFLLNKKRALEFRDCVREGGKAISMFAFASIKALSQYRIEEIVEMGVDGVWIGYEGTASGYAKQNGRDPAELFRDLKKHGISILASMIVGLPYQDEETVHRELAGLLELEPDLGQYLIYGPTPGTPFYEKVMEEGTLRSELAADQERYYRKCDGFSAMVEHQNLDGEEIEALQQHCFEQDFQVLGPTIYRSLRTWLNGFLTWRDSENPLLRDKADRYRRDIRNAYPVFLAGRLFGPNSKVRGSIAQLQREIHAHLGKPTLKERLLSVAAVAAAVKTAVTLRFDYFQHPRTVRHAYRLPAESPRLASAWRRLTREHLPVSAELRSERTVWLHLDGSLTKEDVALFAEGVRQALNRTRDRLVLDLKRLNELETEAASQLAEILVEYRERIRILTPTTLAQPGVAAALAVFALYPSEGLLS